MKELFYVPNLICYFRLLLVGIGCISFKQNAQIGIVFIWISGFLDIFDGYFARKLKQTTLIGEYLDMLCDRITDAVVWCAIL